MKKGRGPLHLWNIYFILGMMLLTLHKPSPLMRKQQWPNLEKEWRATVIAL